MFPGKRGLTKRIPAGLSSARACASAQGPSRKESGGLSPSFILLQKNISPKDQMFSRGAKTLAETRTAALNFTQSCCLSSYAWGFTCWQFQHLLPKSHLPSAFLSSLFFSAFPPCAATHLPSPSWREVLPWEASNRRLPNAEWSLPYLDGDHPGFTVLGLCSSLWSNSSEDKGASPVKQSSESSPWLSPPWWTTETPFSQSTTAHWMPLTPVPTTFLGQRCLANVCKCHRLAQMSASALIPQEKKQQGARDSNQ